MSQPRWLSHAAADAKWDWMTGSVVLGGWVRDGREPKSRWLIATARPVHGGPSVRQYNPRPTNITACPSLGRCVAAARPIFIANEAWHTTGANRNLCDTGDPAWYYFWSNWTANATDDGWRRRTAAWRVADDNRSTSYNKRTPITY